jgi:tryptophanyl-tRNA synthetase
MGNLYMFTKIKQEKVSYQVFSYVREKNISYLEFKKRYYYRLNQFLKEISEVLRKVLVCNNLWYV